MRLLASAIPERRSRFASFAPPRQCKKPLPSDLDVVGRKQLKRLLTKQKNAVMVQASYDDDVQYRNKVLGVVKRYSDVLVDSLQPGHTARLPPIRLTFYPQVRPHYEQPYRMAGVQVELMQKEVERLLELGAIVPSSSPWGSPVIFVPKKNGQMRMCIDYRTLNKKVIASRFPIPRISEYLETAIRYKWFSLVDLKDGYHQLRLSQESQACTAFSTKYGHYKFTRLPFGLNCAPMEFQRAMQSIFPRDRYPWVLVYIDDILIMANTRQEALSRLEETLAVLRNFGIKANRQKSELVRTRVHYLGHTIQHGTVGMEPVKVRSILSAPPPRNITELRSFVGLANYYRNFIPRFSSLAGPLHAITGLTHMPVLRREHMAAINALKAAISEMRILHSFDPHDQLHVHLYSDASDTGIGAVLEHESGRPISFYSRRLTTAENNYTIYEKELLALVTAAEQWRHITLGGNIIYHVDNRALSFLQSNKLTNPRVARWVTRLAFLGVGELSLLRSEDNPVADWLSRYSYDSAIEQYIIPLALSGGG